MTYVRLDLKANDDAVNAAISMFTEDYLKQAHHLLSVVFDRNSPSAHFGLSAAVMTLLAIASASSIRHFNPATGKKGMTDNKAFKDFVQKYFPWNCLELKDDQHRRESDRRKAAAEDLYAAIRNPLIHAGGVVGVGGRTVVITHVFPGLTYEQNEQAIEDICRRTTLDGQTVIELSARTTTVHTREFYWAAREAIQCLSEDHSAEKDIRTNLVR